MIVHRGYEGLNPSEPVVTAGIFDGVHRGHMALLERLVLRAGERGGESVVITFSPHPRLVLTEEREKQVYLTTTDEKRVLLEKCNIGHLVIIDFTPGFSLISAEEFIRNILAEKIGAKHLVIGYDHHFGRDACGDYMMIRSLAEFSGFTVEQVGGVMSGDLVISSSLIRRALTEGRINDANDWLGHCYQLGGKIVEGRGLGRLLGFPTANIMPGDSHKLIPADGVYAVEVILDAETYPGMLSIGHNPTINKGKKLKTIEVHLVNFKGEIYGKEITIIFRHRLRDEIAFDTTVQLIRQIERDRQETLRLLS